MTTFFLFLLLKGLDKALLHPCAREEYRLGTHALPSPALISTSLAHHRPFGRQHPSAHDSGETINEQIHSFHKTVLNRQGSCPRSDAGVESSTAPM